MKSDVVFAFENASWPVLVVSDSGLIHGANLAATALFGGITGTGGASATAIWSPDNDSTLETFLARLDRLPGEPVVLKFRAKTGETAAFETYLAPFTKEGQKCCLLQLLKAAPAGRETARPPEPAGAGKVPPAVESSVAHKQKLECALQLTRTVALDFNNALTSILGHASLILNKTDPAHPWRSSLVEIEKSAEKAAEVAADLAAFSRQEKDARTQASGNLNDVVHRAAELFQNSGARRIQWSLELEPNLYSAVFEEAKLQQAFLKILDNAVQAVGEGGRIAVRTRNEEITRTEHGADLRLNPGHYVCIEFEDAGCGIAPDVLPRIFEPFFTTKNSPAHRGLGLAWVWGIVTNHGGSVAVASELGRGTKVRVFLPAQKKIVKDRAVPTDALGGAETILVVDDEMLLLTMSEMVLSSFGYRVLTVDSGEKALELFSENQAQIDLVITDLVMPKMGGRELIERLRKLAPSMKIICSSGYARATHSSEQENYLQKPFTSVDLLRKVRQVLGNP